MTWSRRSFLQALGGLPIALVAWVGLGAGCSPSRPTCYDPEMLSTPERSLRTSRGYSDVSPHGDARRCAGCQFFRARAADGCGRCEILGGPVSEAGHCDAWSAVEAT